MGKIKMKQAKNEKEEKAPPLSDTSAPRQPFRGESKVSFKTQIVIFIGTSVLKLK